MLLIKTRQLQQLSVLGFLPLCACLPHAVVCKTILRYKQMIDIIDNFL